MQGQGIVEYALVAVLVLAIVVVGFLLIAPAAFGFVTNEVDGSTVRHRNFNAVCAKNVDGLGMLRYGEAAVRMTADEWSHYCGQ